MNFILLLELPVNMVTQVQRIEIQRILVKISYERPKRNVYLLKDATKELMEELKKVIIKKSHPNIVFKYYQLAEE